MGLDTQLSQIIVLVAAPAFLLGADAAFISLLIARLNRIIDRLQALNEIGADDVGRASLKADLPRLKRRNTLLKRAIYFATISAIVTSLPVIVAFVSAFLNFEHEHGVAILFIVALVFFTMALIDLARESHSALHEIDHCR